MSSDQGRKISSRKRSRDEEAKKTPSLGTATFGRCINVSERYRKICRIGEGTYGIVYKAVDKETDTIVALKRCIPHHESSDGFPLTALREIHALRVCCQHPNVVALETVAVSKTGVFLVFEHCEHDLAHLIDNYYRQHRRSPFREPNVKTLLRQLLSALEFIHSKYLLHRDIKLSNLLYKKGSLRVADFGLSRRMGKPPLTATVASLWYRPPELLFGSDQYTSAVDLWAAGCVFGELLQGYPLMNGTDEVDQLHKMVNLLGFAGNDWPSNLQPHFESLDRSARKSLLDQFSRLSGAGLELITNLLHCTSNLRWTATRSLQSTYFSEEPAATATNDMPQFPSHEK